MKKIMIALMLLAPLALSAQQVEKLQKKADGGDTKAMRELAAHYEVGYGLPVDTAKALELYRKADAAGNADAKGDLSRLAVYYSALGHDSTESYRLAKASADAGSPYGTYRLAVCYLDGIGVTRDRQRFRELNEKAIAMGCEEALALKGRQHLFGSTAYPHDLPKAYECLKKLKSKTCHTSKYFLMAAYYNIMGDEKTALKWIDDGAKVGNAGAIGERARFMQYGWGMPRDERAALAEYRRLKEKFHGDANFKSLEANLLAYAQDTTLRDPAMALRLFEEIGDERGYGNYDHIALSYIFGNFTPIDTNMAYRYWLRGARKGDVSSMEHLASYHQINGNIDSARYYMQMAYNEESGNAAQMLAAEYFSEDQELANRYAQRAADWGNEEMRVAMGELYASQGNNDKAMECYDKAIDNAYYDAYGYKAVVIGETTGNEKKFVKVLEEGSRKGSSRCNAALGAYYENKEDYREAAKYYELAGEPQSDYQLARLYINGALDKDSVTAESRARGLVLLRRSAQAGNRDGMYWLGYAHQQAIGVEQNLDSALYWYRQLADMDDGRSLMQLAIAYEHGRGVQPDTALAMDYYRRAGEAGESDGYAFLGDFYRNGTSFLPADSAKAFEYYQMAADIEGDNAAGLYYVADSYLRGIGVAKDTAQALPYLRSAAAMGSYTSMGVLGDYYNYGWPGVEQDGDSALYYYFEASKGDDPRGDYMIGSWLWDQEMYSKAVEYYGSAASHGNVDAMVSYAVALLTGEGVEQPDPETGYSILENVANANTGGRAFLLLSTARLMGLGCTADTALAVRYLDSSAAMGNASAMMTMGNFYAAGEVVPRDTVKTLEWYNRAVAAGSTTAMKRLAASHQSGEVVPLDKKRAAELYQMAADRGDLEAMCRLGLCYEEGEGVILNSRKAYNLYMQAAEKGSTYGIFLVAMCYVEGVYVKEDMEQAAQWFLKGAEAGDVRCCYYIGQLYANGEGVKKNKKEAKRWLTVAAEAGMEAAEQALREL